MGALHIQGKSIDLARSQVVFAVDTFNPCDWRQVGRPTWRFEGGTVSGGEPGCAAHGQIFHVEPLPGDIVMSFEATAIAPCCHDVICWFRTALNRAPWGEGYLAGFGGWFRGRAGIERVPDFALASTDAGFPVAPGRRYQVVAGAIGAQIFLCTCCGAIPLCWPAASARSSGNSPHVA